AAEFYQTLFDHVLGEGTHAVAAHLRLGAVGVEHTHEDVSVAGRFGDDQAVGAGTGVTRAHRHREGGPIAFLRYAIDMNEVVAGAVVLRELQALESPCIVRRRTRYE